jgi:hypothetical protein
MSSPYGKNFFDTISGASLKSARQILPLVFDKIRPTSMLELGSGTGAWTLVATEQGVAECLAIDGDWVREEDLLISKKSFRRHNLEKPLNLPRRFDLVISLEVAEHLSQSAADNFVTSLTSHGDIVLFGAATKFQGGTHHLNEQWPQYWIDKFGACGFNCFDVIRPLFWNNHDVSFYYKQNTFLFVRRTRNHDLQNRLKSLHADLYARSSDFCFIHPSKFERVANYEVVSLHRFLPKLPNIFFVQLPVAIFKRMSGRISTLFKV